MNDDDDMSRGRIGNERLDLFGEGDDSGDDLGGDDLGGDDLGGDDLGSDALRAWRPLRACPT